jgi:hypothetical protein
MLQALAEAANSNTKIFHLTEPTIYHTRGEHANVTPPGLQPTIYHTHIAIITVVSVI